MQLNMSEADHIAMEDTIVGLLAKCETIKDLVKNLENSKYLYFYIDFTGSNNKNETYCLKKDSHECIKEELDKLKENIELCSLSLRSDEYNVIINVDEFEKEVYIKVE